MTEAIHEGALSHDHEHRFAHPAADVAVAALCEQFEDLSLARIQSREKSDAVRNPRRILSGILERLDQPTPDIARIINRSEQQVATNLGTLRRDLQRPGEEYDVLRQQMGDVADSVRVKLEEADLPLAGLAGTEQAAVPLEEIIRETNAHFSHRSRSDRARVARLTIGYLADALAGESLDQIGQIMGCSEQRLVSKLADFQDELLVNDPLHAEVEELYQTLVEAHRARTADHASRTVASAPKAPPEQPQQQARRNRSASSTGKGKPMRPKEGGPPPRRKKSTDRKFTGLPKEVDAATLPGLTPDQVTTYVSDVSVDELRNHYGLMLESLLNETPADFQERGRSVGNEAITTGIRTYDSNRYPNPDEWIARVVTIKLVKERQEFDEEQNVGDAAETRARAFLESLPEKADKKKSTMPGGIRIEYLNYVEEQAVNDPRLNALPAATRQRIVEKFPRRMEEMANRSGPDLTDMDRRAGFTGRAVKTDNRYSLEPAPVRRKIQELILAQVVGDEIGHK